MEWRLNMKGRRRTFLNGRLSVELLVLATLFGCGGSAESTVSGLVTLDGVPLRKWHRCFFAFDKPR